MLAQMTRMLWQRTGLLLYTVCAIALAIIVSAVLLTDDASAQTDPPIDGNWTVDDNTLVRDAHILLNGNLTIGPQGHLTLENVSLELNNTFPGRYHIIVSSGGWMIVTDKDGDPTTTADASQVYSRRPNTQFSWWCAKDSVLRISASTVRQCGGSSRGIWIETDDAIIRNSTIGNGSYGIYVEDGTVRVYDSTIEECRLGGIFVRNGTAIVEGCTIFNNTLSGIDAIYNSDVVVKNSTIRNSMNNGLFIGSSSIIIEDSVVHDTGELGLEIYNSPGRVVRTSVFNTMRLGILIEIQSNVSVIDSEVFDIRGTGITYFYANGTVRGTHVHDCRDQGLLVTGSGIEVLDSTFENCDQGVVIKDSMLYIVDNCTIRWNRDSGIVFSNFILATSAGWVLRSNIYENAVAGIYVTLNTTCILWDPYIRDNGQYGIYCRLGGRVEWEVTGTSTVVNETLEYVGTIDINKGGELTLINTTLEVNKDRFGDIGYVAVNNGQLWIRDGSPDVNGDQTEILPDASSLNDGTIFNLSVYNDGRINATRSIFTSVRVRVFDGVFGGVDCQFEFAKQAVYGDGSEAFIELVGCTFTDGEQGIVTEDGARVKVSACSFFRMEEGLNIYTSDNSEIEDSTMFSTEVGIRLWRAGGFLVNNCTFTLCNDAMIVIDDAVLANRTGVVYILGSKIDRSNGHGIRAWNATVDLYRTAISRCSAGGIVMDDGVLRIDDSSLSNNNRVGIRANETILDMKNTSVTSTDGIGVWNSLSRTLTGFPIVNDRFMRDSFLQGSTAYDLRLEGEFTALVFNTRLEPEDARVFEEAVLEVYNNGILQVMVEGVQPVPPPPIDYVLIDQFGMVTGVGTFPNETNVHGVDGKSWTMTANDTTIHSPYKATVTVAGREWTGDLELGFDITSTIWIDLELLPIIEFPDEIVEGSDIDLDASNSIGYPFNITQWSWETDGEDIRYGPQAMFIFPSDGEYEVRLLIIDAAGNTNSTTIWLTVLDAKPEASIITDVPDEVDEDQVLDLEGRYVTVVDDIIIQEWDFGDGNKANGVSVSHSWSTPGEYNITFTIVEADGSQAEDTRVITVVNVAPVAIIKEVDLVVGKGERFDLDGSPSTDTPSDNGTLSYLWDMGGDPFLTGAQAFWRFEAVGVYEINLLVLDDDGAWDKTTMTVTVINAPPTFGPIPDVRLNDTDKEWSFKLLVGDPDDDLANLTINTPEFEPGGAFNLRTERDDDGGWTLYVKPIEGREGRSGEVTLTVRDMDEGFATSTFEIFVKRDETGGGVMLWLILLAVAILVVVTLGLYKLARKQVPPPSTDEGDEA
jgi:hypothetical protein